MNSLGAMRGWIQRSTMAAMAISALMTSTAYSEQVSYEFTPFPGAIAIANDGTVLTTFGVCRHGKCEDGWVGTVSRPLDINASGTVVGWSTDSEGGVPECQPTYGIMLDRNGRTMIAGSALHSISDNGTALGSVSYCIAGVAITVINGEVDFLWNSYPRLGSLGASPLSINNAGVILARCYDGGSRHVLSDGESLTILEPPDAPGALEVDFEDLNDRGQTVGWWMESVSHPSWREAPRYHGFLRQASGEFLPIEWDFDWSESITRKYGDWTCCWTYKYEDVTLHLQLSLGTQVFALNDRGDVVAKTKAWYRGVLPSGMTVNHFEEVDGIGSPHGIVPP